MKKVFCFVPNGHVIIGYLDSSKYGELIHLKDASIVAKNKTGTSDYSEVIKKGLPGIKVIEPLGKDVRLNAMYLNMSYMHDDAEVPLFEDVQKDRIISALDRRFLFISDKIDLSELNNGYVNILNVDNIKSYSGGKGLGLGKYELTKIGEKHKYSLYNLLFLVGKIY